MLSTDRFVSAFGSTPPGDLDSIVRVGVGAVRLGFAIVVDRPESKIPTCILNTRDAKKADTLAQEASREAGNPRWQNVRHDCGLKHAITDDKQARTVLNRLTKDGARFNLGVELGASRMVVVDVDTPAEDAAFQADWAASGGPEISMTVSSPGVCNEAGEWVHKDGGHYWFELEPDVELPVGTGAMKVETELGAYTVMWAARQVLVPPSVRPEGPYRLTGQINVLPGWLHDKIVVEVGSRRERAERRIREAGDEDNEIDRWSTLTSWDEILRPTGWEPTGIPDGCSCLIWTAPGVHASPKSATAHDAGCSHYDTYAGHGPLHIWTDNPPEFLIGRGKTMTKIQYLSYRDHDGAIGPVLRDLGFKNQSNQDPISPIDSKPPVELPKKEETKGLGSLGKVRERSERKATPEPDIEIEAGEDPAVTAAKLLMAKMRSSAELNDIPDPEPLIDGLLDLDTFCRITGKSNHGKSFVMLDVACAVAMGRPWHGHDVTQGMVVYMVAEGARGWKRRLRAWEAAYNNGEYIPADRLQILDEPVQTSQAADWAAWRAVLCHLNPVLVIMDTQARITIGTNENDAAEMGIFVERCEQIRRETGACVAVVHHLGHSGDQGRGSSAVLGAINTELRVVKEKDTISVVVEKQKDDAFADPLKFHLVDAEESAVLELANGTDPLDLIGTISMNSVSHDRMTAILYGYFNQDRGATQAQVLGLAMDQKHPIGKMSKSSAHRAWKHLLDNAKVEGVLDDNGNMTQRFKVKPSEVERLGLDKMTTDA